MLELGEGYRSCLSAARAHALAGGVDAADHPWPAAQGVRVVDGRPDAVNEHVGEGGAVSVTPVVEDFANSEAVIRQSD